MTSADAVQPAEHAGLRLDEHGRFVQPDSEAPPPVRGPARAYSCKLIY